MKKTPTICWLNDNETPSRVVTRARMAYLFRAARSRKSVITHCGNGYIIDDTKLFAIIA
jgi:hypothetical protein